jgi:phosphatidylinositol alpha-1,6-mannosyltransferase
VSTPRILFVTRNYPPVQGGMEQYCFDLFENLSRIEDVTLLANRRGKRGLPLFLPRVAVHLLLHARRYSHVHFGDASLTLFQPLVRALSRARVTVTTYGLDMVFANALYQRWIPRQVARADAVVCISRATLRTCTARGVDASRCTVVPCGIDFQRGAPPATQRAALAARFGLELDGRRVLFSIARLVPRKGHAWFVREVMPRLPADFLYCVAGDGPERDVIRAAAEDTGVADRVELLGPVSEADKAGWLETAERFVMPNLHVEGDLEGFGITLIEAAAHGLAAVAARVDGIPDAVVEGRTGALVPEADARAFAEALQREAPAREVVRAAAREHFDWERLARRYAEILRAA